MNMRLHVRFGVAEEGIAEGAEMEDEVQNAQTPHSHDDQQ